MNNQLEDLLLPPEYLSTRIEAYFVVVLIFMVIFFLWWKRQKSRRSPLSVAQRQVSLLRKNYRNLPSDLSKGEREKRSKKIALELSDILCVRLGIKHLYQYSLSNKDWEVFYEKLNQACYSKSEENIALDELLTEASVWIKDK